MEDPEAAPPLPADQPAAADAGAGDDGAAERAKALAAIAALKEKVAAQAAANGQHNGEATAEPAAPEAPARPRKKRFGPPANAPREAPKARKRKSRWETEPKSDSKALIVNNTALWPTDVTLPGGITVCLIDLVQAAHALAYSSAFACSRQQPHARCSSCCGHTSGTYSHRAAAACARAALQIQL